MSKGSVQRRGTIPPGAWEAIFSDKGASGSNETSPTYPLTDAQIDEVWNSMPGGSSGFLKTFGYQQFAEALFDKVQELQLNKLHFIWKTL